MVYVFVRDGAFLLPTARLLVSLPRLWLRVDAMMLCMPVNWMFVWRVVTTLYDCDCSDDFVNAKFVYNIGNVV